MADAHAHDHHDHDPKHGHGGHGHEGHEHAHGHGHSHHHIDASHANEKRIALAAGLTGVFMGVEVAGGLIAGSLALVADAGHMLSDFASLVLAWVGFRIARRPADARRTFGFRRFSVLAAFVNGLALIAVAVWIMFEAAMRIASPSDVMALPMLGVASVGLAVNIIAFLVLHGAGKDNLNMRGALAHVVGDLLGSVAAIAAALIIMWTGWTAADPILSVLVAVLILRSAWMLVRESGHILLEGAPAHLDLQKISRDLEGQVEGVIDIHHAHAWSLDEARPMMTLHAKIAEGGNGPVIVAAIKNRLHEAHGVGHVTVEIETGDCSEPDCD
jgi:cobalt-zinc-cadmium efflux system protein